jgi:hypothetical protein
VRARNAKEVHDIFEDIMSCAGGEELIFCGDNCKARWNHML